LRAGESGVTLDAMSAKRFNIAVSDEGGVDFAKVVAHCRKAGLKVERQMEELGAITGTADADHVEKIRSLPGVLSVEEDRDVGAI